jgi:hypothetical protein
MGFKVPRKGQSVGSGSSYDPIAAGLYQASIYDIDVSFYGSKSANEGRAFVKVQFRIADGQEGENRRLFENIPLFTQWAPTSKNPDGSDAFTFFGFFAAITGVSEKAFRKTVQDALDKADKAAAKSGKDDGEFELPIPEIDSLIGKSLTLGVKIVDDTWKFNEESKIDSEAKQADFKKNIVASFKPAGEIVSKSVTPSKAQYLEL